jgi:hypothetical protein
VRTFWLISGLREELGDLRAVGHDVGGQHLQAEPLGLLQPLPAGQHQDVDDVAGEDFVAVPHLDRDRPWTPLLELQHGVAVDPHIGGLELDAPLLGRSTMVCHGLLTGPSPSSTVMWTASPWRSGPRLARRTRSMTGILLWAMARLTMGLACTSMSTRCPGPVAGAVCVSSPRAGIRHRATAASSVIASGVANSR